MATLFLLLIFISLHHLNDSFRLQKLILHRYIRSVILKSSSEPSANTNSNNDSSKRSRFNEKLIETAKKLREEALELEKLNQLLLMPPQNNIKSNSINDTTVVQKEDSISTTKSKLVGEEFIGRFPIEKMLNTTNIFTMGAFSSDSSNKNIKNKDGDVDLYTELLGDLSNNSTSTYSNNGTYQSVLADRGADSSKKQILLDKLSGNEMR